MHLLDRGYASHVTRIVRERCFEPTTHRLARFIVGKKASAERKNVRIIMFARKTYLVNIIEHCATRLTVVHDRSYTGKAIRNDGFSLPRTTEHDCASTSRVLRHALGRTSDDLRVIILAIELIRSKVRNVVPAFTRTGNKCVLEFESRMI